MKIVGLLLRLRPVFVKFWFWGSIVIMGKKTITKITIGLTQQQQSMLSEVEGESAVDEASSSTGSNSSISMVFVPFDVERNPWDGKFLPHYDDYNGRLSDLEDSDATSVDSWMADRLQKVEERWVFYLFFHEVSLWSRSRSPWWQVFIVFHPGYLSGRYLLTGVVSLCHAWFCVNFEYPIFYYGFLCMPCWRLCLFARELISPRAFDSKKRFISSRRAFFWRHHGVFLSSFRFFVAAAFVVWLIGGSKW